MGLAQREFFSRTRSFTRRGDRISESLQNTWDKYHKDYIIEVQRGFGETTVAEDFEIDLDEVFGRKAPLVIEIGCGAGDQIVNFAKNHPEYNCLGFEVWYPGLVKTISSAVKEDVKNLKLIEVDAVQALPIIVPNNSCAEVWTFFPDPWRKKRHHKRRIVQPLFSEIVANVLMENGVWRLATDWNDYAWHIRDVLESSDRFVNLHKGENPDLLDEEPTRGGFAPRWSERVMTRFEQRGIDAGRSVHDFTFKKNG
ncbi:tRNA (guanosine(46)-N7)-methyltransferase TrmB [Actinomyces sp. zg-332]|nr:tRNA (guanosine(46)-N7)-methyltransferase TrmB [Actinomyces sp. zg-332]